MATRRSDRTFELLHRLWREHLIIYQRQVWTAARILYSDLARMRGTPMDCPSCTDAAKIPEALTSGR